MIKTSVISSKDQGSERQQLITSLLTAVKECQTKFGTKNELATENDEKVAALCHVLELVLSHGLRSKPRHQTALLGQVSELWRDTFQASEHVCFWHFVRLFLTRHEVDRYTNLRRVSSDIGRGRAWLRSALNERSLERYFSLLLAKPEDAAVYYHDWALLLDQELNSTLPNISAGLSAILFAIPIDEARYNRGASPDESCPVIKSEPVLSVPIEEVPVSTRRKKRAPANVVSFDDSDTESLDAVDARIDIKPRMSVTSQSSTKELPTEKPVLPVAGSSPSPSSNDSSSLHDFEPSSSTKNQEMVPTLTPVNDDNVGELMLLSIEGLPGDDVSLGPEADDTVEALLSRRLLPDAVTADQLDQLYAVMENLQEANQVLRNKLKALMARHRADVGASDTKMMTLARENEVLKHQLRKYVSAVQMLNRDGAAHEALAYLEASQQAAQQRDEANKYQEQLIEVAQMHGELMEFNERLTRNLLARDDVIKRLERELTDLRGPLPAGSGTELEAYSPPDALVHIWIPSAFLSGGSSAVHHLYQVYVRMRDTEWNVYRRYAQFYSLHKALKKSFPVVATLDFPPKKAIGNKDAKFVEERRQKLQMYLRQAVDAVTRARPDLIDPSSLINIIPFFSQAPPKRGKSKSTGILKKRVDPRPSSAQYNGL